MRKWGPCHASVCPGSDRAGAHGATPVAPEVGPSLTNRVDREIHRQQGLRHPQFEAIDLASGYGGCVTRR